LIERSQNPKGEGGCIRWYQSYFLSIDCRHREAEEKIYGLIHTIKWYQSLILVCRIMEKEMKEMV
jgi:hypothetical protein